MNRKYITITVSDTVMTTVNIGTKLAPNIITLKRGDIYYVTEEEAKNCAGSFSVSVFVENDEEFTRFIKTDKFYPYIYSKMTAEDCDKYLPDSVVDKFLKIRLDAKRFPYDELDNKED